MYLCVFFFLSLSLFALLSRKNFMPCSSSFAPVLFFNCLLAPYLAFCLFRRSRLPFPASRDLPLLCSLCNNKQQQKISSKRKKKNTLSTRLEKKKDVEGLVSRGGWLC